MSVQLMPALKMQVISTIFPIAVRLGESRGRWRHFLGVLFYPLLLSQWLLADPVVAERSFDALHVAPAI
jgi:hypothetical protein